MKTKTMKIEKNVYNKLNELRGYNGCRTFNDVLNFLLEVHKNYDK